jgi:hypothetical protein
MTTSVADGKTWFSPAGPFATCCAAVAAGRFRGKAELPGAFVSSHLVPLLDLSAKRSRAPRPSAQSRRSDLRQHGRRRCGTASAGPCDDEGVSVRYQPGKVGRCASSCAKHQRHPTSSSRNVAHRFPQPDISAWWPGRAWLGNSPFLFIPTCCGTPAGSSSPTTATTRAPSKPISGTARSCPPSGTPPSPSQQQRSKQITTNNLNHGRGVSHWGQ